jgi:serine/threonine-protein kinase
MSGAQSDNPEIRIGKYLVVEPLQTGGTAAIYLAVMRGENQFTREVVIKRPLPHLLADRRLRTMFIDEAHIASRLNHANIVQVIDLVARDDDVYLVLEYLKGRDLREILRRSNELERLIPPEVSAWIGAEAAAGLDYAHEATAPDGSKLNLVHRDVSPKNIRVTDAGHVKVIDFGIAQAEHRLSETAPGSVKGTLGYMSPEQVLGEALDRRSDVFAFGIVLFQLLTGRNPFEAATLKERIQRLVQAPIPKVRSVRPEVDPQLEAVVERCLEREVELRYPRMSLVQRDLEVYLADNRVASPRQRLVEYLEEVFPNIHDPSPRLRDSLTAISNSDLGAELGLRQPELDPSGAFGPSNPVPSPAPSSTPVDERPTDRSAARAPSGLSGGAWSSWSGPPAVARSTGTVATQPPSVVLASEGATVKADLPHPRRRGVGLWVALGAAVLACALAGIGLGRSIGEGRPVATASGPRGPEAAAQAGGAPVGATAASGPGSLRAAAGTATATVARVEPRPGPGERGAVGERSGEHGTPDATAATAKAQAARPRPPASTPRQYLIAGAHLAKQGQLDDALLLYTLAYSRSGAEPDPAIFRNIALVHRERGDAAKLRACFNLYLSKRPAAPDADRIRAVVSGYPATKSVPCVAPDEAASAEKRALRAGARIEAWVADAQRGG